MRVPPPDRCVVVFVDTSESFARDCGRRRTVETLGVRKGVSETVRCCRGHAGHYHHLPPRTVVRCEASKRLPTSFFGDPLERDSTYLKCSNFRQKSLPDSNLTVTTGRAVYTLVLKEQTILIHRHLTGKYERFGS